MNADPKIVVRLDVWMDAAFAERLAREPDIDLRTCPRAGPEAAVRAALAEAVAYQITPAKDELPRRYFADADLLARCPHLLCVSATGAGCDTIDIPACTAAGVLVVNQAGANARSVAEHTVGAILALGRRMTESDRRLRRSRGFAREELMGREIAGKTLGLVGIGEVGRRVARLAEAFGMTVLAHDPLLAPEEIAARGAEAVAFEALLERSDVVSLHCPRDPATLGMMGAAAFARMRRGAVFVSTARGGIHDEAALAAALESGHLGGAALDVWDVEPPPLDHPLLALDTVLATYHTAGVTPEARAAVAGWAADQLVEVLRGGRPPRLVNPEAWPGFVERRRAVLGIPVSAG
ncbi:NAD(P)-dependent oxidoreductase [Methylobacterium sp. NEAU 140]|uniref:NAD(P)-dependent oxidoreductase n=1 Tax=Methylobacterium sp. NEAU 140 TaxID=3064945 RepID=UPI0027353674|nr:NAD(P)-dependent oxidoreductase [Methylobacterium sp. NEAU 140]MDP4022965.1 NAD(P)-dependent oxidoreductase [Methylobacterium sp. NEAU 140]